MVINLAKEGKTIREISKEVHISLITNGQTLNKVTGNEGDNKEQSFLSNNWTSNALWISFGSAIETNKR